MGFKRYDKVIRLWKDEVDWILEGEVHVQEKIDWANASIWYEIPESKIHIGSRSQDVTNGSFRWLNEYVNNHDWIIKLLREHPEYHLFGEWLVPHTIQYDSKSYKKFYLFDIYNNKTEKFIPTPEVDAIAKKYRIESPKYFGMYYNPSAELLQTFMKKPALGNRSEGIVLKNFDFVNTFGDSPYWKLVNNEFREDNAITFGGNNKESEEYWEIYCANKYVTLSRVEKIMKKMSDRAEKWLDESHTPMICGTVLHDIITEESWEMFNKVPSINFRKLKNIINKKTAKMYKDILSEFKSVAYEPREKIAQWFESLPAEQIKDENLWQ